MSFATAYARFSAVVGKELLLLRRDKTALFFAFAFPVGLAFFLGAMYSGKGQTLRVGVVSGDSGVGYDDPRLPKNQLISLEPFATENDAMEALRKGQTVALVVMRSAKSFEVVSDPAHRHEASLVYALLLQSTSVEHSAESETRVSLRQATIGGRGAPSPYAVSFPQGMVWALLGAAATFATSLAAERRRGTLARMHMAPLFAGAPLFATVLACALVAICIQLIIVAGGVALVGLTIESPLKLFATVAVVSLCTAAIIIGAATLVRTERAAGSLVWGAGIVMAMLGGGMFPLFLFPEWLDRLSFVSPLRWATLSLEGALWRGADWAELLPSFGVLGVAAVFFLGVGVCMTRPA